MRPLGACLVCMCALLVAVPSAQGQIAPPGNGGVDEYLETLPQAEGNRPTDRNRRSSGGLTPRARRQLGALGEDGRAAAALAEATAPGRDGSVEARGPGQGTGEGQDSAGKNRGPGGEGREPADEGGSALGTLLSRLLGGDSNPGGTGALLPLLVVGTLAGAIALAVLRRRRSSS